MKKISLAFAILALVSCTRETPQFPGGAQSIRCTFIDDDAVTKSILIDNPGNRMINQWEDGDRIGIFSSSSENQLFTLSGSSISVDGKSAEFISSSVIPGGSLQGYMPYQEEAVRTGSGISLALPSVQYGASTELNIERPDPAANILVAEGDAASGLSFRPVMAVLKIGQLFDSQTELRRLEFRDLSGAAVAGSISVSGGSVPKAEITGSVKVITLELADDLTLEAGAMRPFFLIVPAREYPKGFEITFIDASGNKTVSTVGTKMGKTLQRGVVYPIGDLPAHNYLDGVESTLAAGSQIITPKKSDLIRIVRIASDAVLDVDGITPVKDELGYSVFRPSLEMLVHKDMAPAVGQRYIFDYGSAQFPEGGVFTISSAEKLNEDYFRVYARTEPNIAAAYDYLSAGDEMYDAEGNEIEGAGIPLDFANYVTDILDTEGNSIPFSVSPEGKLLFDEDATTRLTGIPTKASITNKSLSTPKLSIGFSEKNATVGFSSSMDINFRIAIGFVKNELQYIYYKANPTLNLSVNFSLKADFSKDISKTLITFVLAPIPIAPGVLLLPEVQLVGKAGITGNLAFSASVKRSFDLGSVGIAYNKGDGFSVHTDPPKPGKDESFKPELGGVTGYLGAYGALSIRPYVSVYRMFGIGVDMDLTLSFGLSLEGKESKLALVPSLSFTPRYICLGGYYTNTVKKFQASFEFDPLWERYLTPHIEETKHFYPVGPTRSLYPFYYVNDSGRIVLVSSPYNPYLGDVSVFAGFDGVAYGIKASKPTVEPWTVYLEVVSGKVEVPSWRWLMFDVGFLVNTDYCEWDEKSITVENRSRIMSIPVDYFEEIKAEGIAADNVSFTSGKTYGFRIVAISSSGSVYYPGVGAMTGGKMHPFTFFWPNTPDGPYFVEEEVVNVSSGVPRKEKGSEKSPDGYWNGYWNY